jgi:hypothetical protein
MHQGHVSTSDPKFHDADHLLTDTAVNDKADEVPPLKGLSLLDRFLVLWIILAMAIGILLGNLVPSTGPALRKGEFVGVSIPIGLFPIILRLLQTLMLAQPSAFLS